MSNDKPVSSMRQEVLDYAYKQKHYQLTRKKNNYTIKEVSQESLDRFEQNLKNEEKKWVRNGLLSAGKSLLTPFSKAKDFIADIKSGKYGNPSNYV
jgi:hypothetical protein